MGNPITLTKYKRNDANTDFDYTTLLSEDDAATQNWGVQWRMPTKQEWRELIDNCNKEWTTVNGVSGYRFTSNKEGFTSNSIFLPAAGYIDNTTLTNKGVEGNIYYWTSSLYDPFDETKQTYSPEYAYVYEYDSNHNHWIDYEFRAYGIPIRAVQVPVVNTTMNETFGVWDW